MWCSRSRLRRQVKDYYRLLPRTIPRLQSKFGECAFSHAGPAAWNRLPEIIRQAQTQTRFKYIEMGKNPDCLSSVLFGIPNIRVRSVRVLSSYQKIKVRFWFGSLRKVFGSVRFGSMRVLIHIYLVYMFTIYTEYTVRVKQKSCAIAKMTAQCALHIGALKVFWTP